MIQELAMPRLTFKSKNRYGSFTYPQVGFSLNRRLSVSKIGNIEIKSHHPIKGEVRTLTLKRENGHWYAYFSVVVERQLLPQNDKAMGIDVGLSSFAVLSDGAEIENPHMLKKQQKRLRRAQRRVARRKKFSKRWKEAVRIVAKIHRQVS
jgi:putative transposase